ncbi:alpha,alpha-trehalase TreF [Gillisia sp. Q332]|uniref:alpha,alpha-trehalase TreF n=1 Tax=Gillisia xinjiangensis TaxID=3384765 RepID=UPI0039197C09
MKQSNFSNTILSLSLLFLSSCATLTKPESREAQIFPPEELYGELFFAVQTNKDVFEDSKTFVDAVPLYDVAKIRNDYAKLESKSANNISKFVYKNFTVPEQESVYKTDSSSINEHITKLWDVLKRPADKEVSGTLLPLPHPYIVPGGRFREIYYWDSYFTMLGLQEDGEIAIIQNMVDNFSHLINEFGFIPNGNRTYYLSRSQPPFYSLMVDVLAESKSDSVYTSYLETLLKEYDFWMTGSESLNPSNNSIKRVVRLEDGTILNRYWDEKNTPRPESYREDVETATLAIIEFPNLKREEVYRNLRAGAESGWDFSSRWLTEDKEDGFKLSTIHTTDIIPVDLNSLLFHLEETISKAYKLKNDSKNSEIFQQKALTRKNAIQNYLWDDEKEFFMDYNFIKRESTPVYSLAGVYPLFFELADNEQAEKVTQKIKEMFLKPGGVVTTPYNTDQQWDAPNGWAPLQSITISGLRNYDQNDLAGEIKERWLNLNKQVYKDTYKLLEKYNVEDLSKESGGGEYPTQDGFGWTNGVFQKLSKE